MTGECAIAKEIGCTSDGRFRDDVEKGRIRCIFSERPTTTVQRRTLEYSAPLPTQAPNPLSAPTTMNELLHYQQLSRNSFYASRTGKRQQRFVSYVLTTGPLVLLFSFFAFFIP